MTKTWTLTLRGCTWGDEWWTEQGSWPFSGLLSLKLTWCIKITGSIWSRTKLGETALESYISSCGLSSVQGFLVNEYRFVKNGPTIGAISKCEVWHHWQKFCLDWKWNESEWCLELPNSRSMPGIGSDRSIPGKQSEWRMPAHSMSHNQVSSSRAHVKWIDQKQGIGLVS
jgi:hypothetical protein